VYILYFDMTDKLIKLWWVVSATQAFISEPKIFSTRKEELSWLKGWRLTRLVLNRGYIKKIMSPTPYF